MYYIFSNDLCGFCPDVRKVPGDAPIVVVSVCNHASFHMLSYLLDEIDVSRIQQIHFVDVSPLQIAHHKRTVQAIVDNPDDRLKIVEDMLGVRFAERFHKNSDLLQQESVWEDCDVSGFEATTGQQVIKQTEEGLFISGVVPGMYQNEMFLLQLPYTPPKFQPKPKQKKRKQKQLKRKRLERPDGAGLIWAGYDYGFLREKENLRWNLKSLRDRIFYMKEPIETFCQRTDSAADTHVFVWVSNIMASAPFRKSGRSLQVSGRRPKWHLWVSTPRGKHRNENAHAYATKELAILAGDAVVEVVHTPKWVRAPRRDEFFKSYETIEYRKFLKTNRKFGSLSLHILLGHGVSVAQFKAVYKKALSCCERLFVMEHNSESLDKACFPQAKMSVDDICKLVNVKGIRYAPGAFCNRRNFIVTCK